MPRITLRPYDRITELAPGELGHFAAPDGGRYREILAVGGWTVRAYVGRPDPLTHWSRIVVRDYLSDQPAGVRAIAETPDRPATARALAEGLLRGLAEVDGVTIAEPRPALDLPLGAGEDDAEVWVPPRTDCMLHRYDKPCPHCGAVAWHVRTQRCGECGRRPSREPSTPN